MMNPMRDWMIGSALVGAMVTGAAMAEDWPQWGGTDCRNPVSAEKNLPVTFDPDKGRSGTGGNVKWVRKTGGAAFGNPTVANGRVYVGTDDASLSDDDRLKRTRGGIASTPRIKLFRGSIPCPRAPLPTLATRPYGRTAMARGRFGALLPYRMALSSTTLRQLLAHLPGTIVCLRNCEAIFCCEF